MHCALFAEGIVRYHILSVANSVPQSLVRYYEKKKRCIFFTAHPNDLSYLRLAGDLASLCLGEHFLAWAGDYLKLQSLPTSCAYLVNWDPIFVLLFVSENNCTDMNNKTLQPLLMQENFVKEIYLLASMKRIV